MDEKRYTFHEDAAKHRWQINGVVSTIGLVFGALFRKNLIAQGAVATLFGYLLTGKRYEYFYIFWKTWYRDYIALRGLLRLLYRLSIWERRNCTVCQIFDENAQKNPDRVAFRIDDRAITFKSGEEMSNQIAWYFKSRGFNRGDVVAIFMESKPELVLLWLGLNKVGLVAALINNNLKHDSLIHCISTANCRAVIFGEELLTAIKDVRGNEQISSIKLYQFNMSDTPILETATNLSEELKSMPAISPKEDIKMGNSKDKILYIYTSGTTGFPKAAIITNMRYMLIAKGTNAIFSLTEDDIIYVPLPLYHTAGGVLGVGQAVINGNTVALRKKFSASNYWKDCVKYNCTVAQYIGEICRYLLSTPECEYEKTHKVRLVLGNGLRAQIWMDFVKRFNIQRVGEFYGATEGNSNLVNVTSKVGAVGFMTRAASFIYPLKLVRCDEITGDIIRDTRGYCIPCEPMEPGVMIGKVNPKKAMLTFAGYADRTATDKKLLRNVFKDGDCYFNSGDILVMDHYGYFYFKDRTGDTFRWRAENVSTTEVEEAINKIIGLNETIVYGVTVPNTEGRAGMAAIVDSNNKVDLNELALGLRQSLPAYAVPLFLRILPQAPLTSTFKLRKKELVEEGYDPHRMQDKLYFLDQKLGLYVPLNYEIYDDIVKGKIRL